MLLGVSGAAERGRARVLGRRLTRQSTAAVRVPTRAPGATPVVAGGRSPGPLAQLKNAWMKRYTPTPTAASVSRTSPSCSGYIAGRLGAIVRRRRRLHMGTP